MPTKPLTDAACRAAKPREKLYKLSDGGGLQFWVQPTGSRAFRLAYRFDGKQRTMTIGPYPDVSLGEARDVRVDVRRLLRQGIDPVKKKEAEKAPVVHGFEDVAREWYQQRSVGWKESHRLRVWRRLEVDVFPYIADRDIASLKRSELLVVLLKVEGRGVVDMAKRVKQTISAVFRFAMSRDWVDADPTTVLNDAMKPPPKVKHRAFARETELPALLRAIDAYGGEPTVRLAMTLIMQTMVRTNEARFAAWAEFEGLDGDRPLWRIPADRMKMGAEHQVPLSRQTVRLLQDVKLLSRRSPYLFPSGITKTGFMSENTLIYALYRMGYHSKVTVHGFRSTASTILNESGRFNSDWIERQLAHVEKNEVRAAYNAAQWLQPRRDMLQWWADKLDELRKPKDSLHAAA